MANYSIAITSSETRVYIYPPLTKPVQYIEVLECHIPGLSCQWLTFTESQEISYVEDNFTRILNIKSGLMSLEYLKWLLRQTREKYYVSISTDGVRYFLRSDKYDDVTLSSGLADALGVPEKLVKNRSYTIQRQPETMLKVYCDIVEEDSSYENKETNADSIKLTQSQLLAIIPSNKYPCLKVSQTKNPINYFTLTILDEYGNKRNLCTKPIRIQLKLSF